MSATHTDAPNLVTSDHGGLLGEWTKYNQNYFIYLFIYALFGNSPARQTRRRIFAQDDSNDAHSRKDVPFWVSLIWLHI